MSKSFKTNNVRTDVYARVTDRIVADLEAGTRPWMKPWANAAGNGQVARPLRHNGVPYRGVNVLMLWADAMDKGFSSPVWMTYQQAQELGAHVRKGETGSLVVYADRFTRTDHADYLAHWLSVLKNDKRAIFTAAAQAQRAADYLHSLQEQPEG